MFFCIFGPGGLNLRGIDFGVAGQSTYLHGSDGSLFSRSYWLATTWVFVILSNTTVTNNTLKTVLLSILL